MTHAVGQTGLRLVGAYDDRQLANWAAEREAREAITRENERAAANQSLDPTDPRWVLAVEVQAQLQGATITPERRKRLMKTARAIGVRPFDANLIVAIVQDHARCGTALTEARGLLTLIRKPKRVTNRGVALRWLAAFTAAAAGTAALMWLLTQ